MSGGNILQVVVTVQIHAALVYEYGGVCLHYLVRDLNPQPRIVRFASAKDEGIAQGSVLVNSCLISTSSFDESLDTIDELVY